MKTTELISHEAFLEHVSERLELAGVYALDGAYRRAADILVDVASQLRNVAHRKEAALHKALR